MCDADVHYDDMLQNDNQPVFHVETVNTSEDVHFHTTSS